MLWTPGPGATLIPDETAVLSDPLVIRPTSETIIWSTFSRWIQVRLSYLCRR
mgnify:FL=1